MPKTEDQLVLMRASAGATVASVWPWAGHENERVDP